MASSGPAAPPAVSRLLRHRWARLGAPLVILCALLGADVAAGPAIRIGGLMVAVPALSAGFLAPAEVLAVVAVTLPFVVVASATNNQLDAENFPVSISTVIIISAASVAAAAARRRREHELAQARWVAAMTQRVLLRPLPHRIGTLQIASRYLAADEEATIGGDVYATALLPGRARLLVGDVQGKGLAAVQTAGDLLNAFRRSARQGVVLADLPGFLDRALRADLADSAGDGAGDGAGEDDEDDEETAAARRRVQEGFVTAVMVDFPEGDQVVQVANRGHPPPLLIHRDEVRALDPARTGAPLGLGDLDGDTGHVDPYAVAVGDTLLLYTDGVTEARDARGVFYPLAERLERWTGYPPERLLDAVRADLLQHADSRLADDVAMVAVRRTA